MAILYGYDVPIIKCTRLVNRILCYLITSILLGTLFAINYANWGTSTEYADDSSQSHTHFIRRAVSKITENTVSVSKTSSAVSPRLQLVESLLDKPIAGATNQSASHSQSEVSQNIINDTRNSSVVPHGDALSRLNVVPILLEDEFWLTGALNKKKGFLTIGIPTIYRESVGTSYIKLTMQSLISNLTPADKHRVTILIFLADFQQDYKEQLKTYIQDEHSEHLQSGLIVLLEVSQSAYPQLNKLKQNYADEAQRVTWRAKQAVDFAFMFYVARNMSLYYVQIEDDVVTVPDFVSKTERFIETQKTNWVTLLLSELGFIGKLYRSSELERLSRFFLMFYQEEPVDFLYLRYARILTQPYMPLRKPTLFQHIGTYSSLQLESKQRDSNRGSRDRYFEGSAINVSTMDYNADNPPARIYTSLKTYNNHHPKKAYGSGSYFWAKSPAINDTFVLVFKRAEIINKIIIETGHPSHNNDFLRHGVVEVAEYLVSEPYNTYAGEMPVCSEWEELDEISFGSVEVDVTNQTMKNQTQPVKCLRLRVTVEQEEWLIIQRISVWSNSGYKHYASFWPGIFILVSFFAVISYACVYYYVNYYEKNVHKNISINKGPMI